jgi:hypothetical protein
MKASPCATLLAACAIVACSRGDTVTGTPEPPALVPATVASISVAPLVDTVRVGERVALYVTLRDTAGGILTDRYPAWTSTDPNVAKVDGSGVVSGLAPGSATIVATSGGVSGSGTVVVYAPTVSSLVLKPSVDTLFTDQHVTLLPTAWDQMGLSIREPLSITWSSSDPSVADVDLAGKITGVSPGSSTITATIGAVRATATVIVRLAPTPAMIDGDWTMTLSPSPSCRDRMPEIARERHYLVHFKQQGADFKLTISAPTLEVANPDENFGSLLGTTIGFVFIGDTEYDGWSSTDLHDHLSDTETLDFDGSVVGVVSGSEITATMSGDVEYWKEPRSFAGPTVLCRATDHVVTLHR